MEPRSLTGDFAQTCKWLRACCVDPFSWVPLGRWCLDPSSRGMSYFSPSVLFGSNQCLPTSDPIVWPTWATPVAHLSKVGLRSNHEVKKRVRLQKVPAVEGVHELRTTAESLTCWNQHSDLRTNYYHVWDVWLVLCDLVIFYLKWLKMPFGRIGLLS